MTANNPKCPYCEYGYGLLPKTTKSKTKSHVVLSLSWYRPCNKCSGMYDVLTGEWLKKEDDAPQAEELKTQRQSPTSF